MTEKEEKVCRRQIQHKLNVGSKLLLPQQLVPFLYVQFVLNIPIQPMELTFRSISLFDKNARATENINYSTIKPSTALNLSQAGITQRHVLTGGRPLLNHDNDIIHRRLQTFTTNVRWRKP